ncbi:symplekin isoform X1 [Ixodes scapularis]|uniref:symplekin isoform X1 n=1 Tax=Ixodes scapularis TaxID=6945 RepID=UPI001161649E|nr:symplekin isoform X1 [Ixodes scapularis]XP_029849656.1 symplekin isoform X1 [Ixodes scapularis]
MASRKKAVDSRRSTAAQFFMDEEQQLADQKSTHDRVVELINQAAVLQNLKDHQKVTNLRQVQELIVFKEPNLLDNFLDEMLAFQNDRSQEIRKFVVGFIEEACKKDPDVFPKVLANLRMMFRDEAVAVQKRVIQAATQLYRVALRWICQSRGVDDLMETSWEYVRNLKDDVVALLDSENDGVRTHTIKFMEMLVILQTYPDGDSPNKSENDFALDDVPLSLKFIKPRKLEEEAKKVFDALVVFHGTSHISSINLMACMQTLVNIAKHRAEFMSRVIQALESLHANLPPTLAKSQVSSVRKHLKLQLLILMKHPAAVDFHGQISTLLTDLGATPQEIAKCMPKPEELKKRARLIEESTSVASGAAPPSVKRIKLETEEEEEEEEEEEKEEGDDSAISKAATNTAIDITAQDLVSRLTTVNVTDIVLVSMLSLPETMPAHFQASYTPIAVAGTETQIKHLARLISTQMTAAGLGKGVEEMMVKAKEQQEEEKKVEETSQPKQTIQTLLGGTTDTGKKKEAKNTVLIPTGFEQSNKGRRFRQLNLADITRPLNEDETAQMLVSAVRRILKAGRAHSSGISPVQVKILAGLATQFGGEISAMLKDYILEDLRLHADIALAWLYEEYAQLQGFQQGGAAPPMDKLAGSESYVHCLNGLLKDVLHKCEPRERDALFGRFFLEIPSITSDALIILKQYCQNESTVSNGLAILRALVDYRPPGQMEYLQKLLELTVAQNQEVRLQSAKHAKQLHERGNFRPIIEDFALMYLRFLLEPVPPQHLFHNSLAWSEDHTKICMQLYISLLPVNHKLIHELAVVYVGAIAEIKRTILRGLEGPVKGMGMSSPELLLLVENCPKGAETLVTRIIHILTDKTPPSAELVARVRDLYHKRVSDVRFLIPVLNGLSKKEVIAALPKLIKLNPIVVKEVFNRLLGSHVESTANFTSPVTPAELLVALHNIDPSKCDVKTVIKATSLCFAEKHVYTQEVLAVVMQQLMEQSPLPTLLMRTVIQSLSLYPRLILFVINILQRLIQKQVWKQKKVWEGFIKCCQRTKPQSLQVLLQLPAEQLQNVFQVSPDLQQPLVQHVSAFTDHQKAHIPNSILELLHLGGRPDAEGDAVKSKSLDKDAKETSKPLTIHIRRDSSRDSRESRDYSREYGRDHSREHSRDHSRDHSREHSRDRSLNSSNIKVATEEVSPEGPET